MRILAARLRGAANVFERRARTDGTAFGRSEGFKLQSDPALQTFRIM